MSYKITQYLKQNNNKIDQVLSILIKIVFVSFLVCFTFISLGCSYCYQWIDADFCYKVNVINNYLELIKVQYLFKILIGLEVVRLAKNYFVEENKEESLKNILVFIIFIILYQYMNKYLYLATTNQVFERFKDFIILVYFSRYFKFNTIMWMYGSLLVLSVFYILYMNLTSKVLMNLGLRGLCFGFSHYNQTGLWLFCVYMAVAYLLRENKVIITLGGLVTFLVIQRYISSRTPQIIIILFIILLWCEPLYKKLIENIKVKKVINVVFVLLPVLLLLMSICLSKIFTMGIISSDGNMMIRFTEFIPAIKEFGLSMYARSHPAGYYFDNGYFQLLILGGKVAFGIIMMLFMLTNFKAFKDNNYPMMIMLVCIYMYLLMEYTIHNQDLAFISTCYIMSNTTCEHKFLELESFIKSKIPVLNKNK